MSCKKKLGMYTDVLQKSVFLRASERHKLCEKRGEKLHVRDLPCLKEIKHFQLLRTCKNLVFHKLFKIVVTTMFLLLTISVCLQKHLQQWCCFAFPCFCFAQGSMPMIKVRPSKRHRANAKAKSCTYRVASRSSSWWLWSQNSAKCDLFQVRVVPEVS